MTDPRIVARDSGSRCCSRGGFMAHLRIIKADEVQPQNIRGQGKEAGQIKRIIGTEKLFFNVDEVSPGYSPHRWHQHTKYTHEGHSVEYPRDFEEIYHIVS